MTHGEAGAADEDGIARARRVLPQVFAAYSPDDMHNADETALMYRHTHQQRKVNKFRQETNARRASVLHRSL
jgi:hypothetical protein